MKSFRDYLAEAEHAVDNPIPGDLFGIVINEELVVETTVTSLYEDGFIIELDEDAAQILESCGCILAELGDLTPHDTTSPIHGGRRQFGVQDSEDSDEDLAEAEYQGRKVPLGKPMRGDVKKFKVYVKDPKTGNVKKVNFGDKNMRIKKSIPARRKSFRARHKCHTAKDRTSARYWSCRMW
jgi:hypothetical protein